MQSQTNGFLLKVSYRIAIHQMPQYEQLFQQQVLPLIREKKLRLLGIWKTLVGDVGEYLELWQFDSLGEFEVKWPSLLEDPRFQELVRTTGPMVKDENFTLLQPVLKKPAPKNSGRLV
ncbi:MAG TPA: NIPSNAP family protein [Acidobacteriota bacterium]|nr:NIPSNAP family protein [Acidobacteriota bacterium]